MTQRIKEYSIGDLARAAGVSVRTLRHYDDIGLLKPAHVGMNGYRIYRSAQALRLQEIMFYRMIGMGLTEIAGLLEQPETPLERLTAHRQVLQTEVRSAENRLALLDRTIAHLKGKAEMDLEDLYSEFPAEKQNEYEAWLIETYGPDMVERIALSKQAIAELPEGMADAMAQLREIETGLVTMQQAGTDATDQTTHELLERHRALMGQFWGRDCLPKAFEGLADMYQSHPDFVARYERLAPRFSLWLPEAMRAHAARLTK
jgi:DNA-binding transcriptional MerR regulator